MDAAHRLDTDRAPQAVLLTDAHIEREIRLVAELLVPVFFVTVGMKVQPATLSPFGSHGQFRLAVVLVVIAIASKLVTGLAVYREAVRRGRSGSAWCHAAKWG